MAASCVTAYLIFASRQDEALAAAEELHHELDLAVQTLAVRMASMATAIGDANDLTPVKFASNYAGLTRSLLRNEERAMALLVRVNSNQEARFENLLASWADDYLALEYPEFSLFPSEIKNPLIPIILVEPQKSRLNVFGFNSGSSPERIAAVEQALSTGFMAVTAPVALSQDVNASPASFLLYYPVIAVGADAALWNNAVIASSVTPRTIFRSQDILNARYSTTVVLTISGIEMPVELKDRESQNGLNLPLLSRKVMQSVRTPGFEIPFSVSIDYVPGVADVLLPLAAGSTTALLGIMALALMNARRRNRAELEQALAARELELGALHRRQEHSQRVEALGRLVGGVAHDFNNILSVIMGNIELLKELPRVGAVQDAHTSQDAILFVEEALAATRRGAHLTQQLLAVGRKSSLTPKTLDPAAVLRGTTGMLARVLPASIKLTISTGGGLWNIIVDESGLHNALLNLAINARDAMAGSGELIIEASNVRLLTEDLGNPSDEELEPGQYVEICVTDTGPGMNSLVLARAFEPFFTTKGVGEGSGLGLPSVLGFCRQSGGTCRIYSERGVGTTVKLILPVGGAAPHCSDESSHALEPANSAGRILFAEDEAAVARVMTHHLSRAGYRVTHVSTGDAALRALADSEAFDVLITDLEMPGTVQGFELARRVAKDHPGMAILLISGNPQEAVVEGRGLPVRCTVLTKPTPRAELLSAVTSAVHRAREFTPDLSARRATTRTLGWVGLG